MMHTRLDPTYLQLVQEAAARAYNRKHVFRQFLRRCGVPADELATCSESETKRVWLDRILPSLEESESGQLIIRNLADSLARHSSFPDLMGWEDSEKRVAAARSAIDALREYLQNKSTSESAEIERTMQRRRAEDRRQKTMALISTRQSLRHRLDSLATDIGTQDAGYKFETWFYDLAELDEVECRRPYVAAGRQIDGTVTVDGTTYLVELRFQRAPSGGPDIDGLLSKVNSKADNTMGLFVAMSGFNDGATRTASFARTPLLLIEYRHLYHVLSGAMTLPELIRRIRRHASQTGEAFLAVQDFDAS